jgi:tetratricopeptide (TPR) repeat protein
LAALIAQAMAKSPDHRPGSVNQLLADIVRFARQYRADTRRLAFSLRTQFEELEPLAASLRDTSVALGIDDSTTDRLADFRKEYPFLVVRGTAVESIPFERSVLNRVGEELQTSRDELGAMLQMRYWCLRQVEAGEQAMSDGDASSAAAMFESVLSDFPDSSRALQLLEESRVLGREQQQRRERVLQLLASARSAMTAGDLGMAQARCSEALELEPNNKPAATLFKEVQQTISREQRRVAESIQRSLEQFESALGRLAFDEAEAALAEADTIQRDYPAVAAARRRLVETRAAAAAADLLRKCTDDEIRLSRAAFRRGRYDEAIQRLEAFLAVEPKAPGAQEELEYLRGLRADIVQRTATAGTRVREQLAKAGAAGERGATEDAHAALREALAWDPTDLSAAEMLNDLLLRQLEARLALERTRARDERLVASAPLLAAARTAMESGYLAVALRALTAVQRISPDLEGLTALIEEVRRELLGDDLEAFELKPLPALEPPPIGGEHKTTTDSGVFERAAEWARSTLRRR